MPGSILGRGSHPDSCRSASGFSAIHPPIILYHCPHRQQIPRCRPAEFFSSSGRFLQLFPLPWIGRAWTAITDRLHLLGGRKEECEAGSCGWCARTAKVPLSSCYSSSARHQMAVGSHSKARTIKPTVTIKRSAFVSEQKSIACTRGKTKFVTMPLNCYDTQILFSASVKHGKRKFKWAALLRRRWRRSC